jgi:hypothetical protein
VKIPFLSRTSNGSQSRVLATETASPQLDLWMGGQDENPDLSGRLKYDTFKQMRTEDPAVRSLSWLYKLPIRSAEWQIVPCEYDPGGPAMAEARADFANWQFGLPPYSSPRLDLTWDELNQQDLLYLDYGAMGAELVWAAQGGKVKLESWTDADGDVHQVQCLDRLLPIFPATVAEIQTDEQTGLISRIRQDTTGSTGLEPTWIPGSKLWWLTNEREGIKWFGESLLRAAYGPWKLKRQVMLAGVIGFDRFANPIPMGRHAATPQAKQAMEQVLRALRSHERAYVTVEGPPPERGGDTEITLLQAAQGGVVDPTPLLRWMDEQIAKAGLEQFSALGTTQQGSRAVGEVLSDPYYLAVSAVAKAIAQARMRWVLRRLWDRNFGEQVPIPEIVASKIQGRNVAVMARALADLSAAGLTFADRETQDDIRDILDLRHLPDVAETVGNLPPEIGISKVELPPQQTVPAEGGPLPGVPATTVPLPVPGR